MVKERKFFRKQANRAEEAAGRTSDPERAASLLALATAFRSKQTPLRGSTSSRKRRRLERHPC
jgi:hypothetical protein